MTNQQRTEHARFAIAAANVARSESFAFTEESVADLLADLRHFCAAEGLDYACCDRIAAIHFEDETAGGA